MKVLTISIAAYNVENYIEKLLDSLVAADRLEELEVLIINDGSKDNTVKLAGEYVSRYPATFRIIDKENGGHGSTINRGIEESTAKFFKIVDGDDWVEPSGLARLVDYLKNSCEDMVLTDYTEYYEQDNTSKNMKETMTGTRQAIPLGSVVDFRECADKLERLQMHMITFKSELLKNNNIRVDEHCFYVDTEYVFYSLPYIVKAGYLDTSVYCYRLGRLGQSMTSESLRKHAVDHIRVNMGLLKAYEKNAKKVPERVRSQMDTMLYDVTYLTYRILLSMNCKKECADKIKLIDERLAIVNPEVYNRFTDGWLVSYRRSGYKNYPVCWTKAKLMAVKERLG